MSRRTVLMLGILATVGGFFAVAADWYSVWTGRHEMDTAFAAGLYTTAIGTAVHASLVYVGIVTRTGETASIEAMTRFFDITAYSMVALILFIATGLSVLILSGRSIYPRWAFFVSPMGLMMISTVLFFALPDGARDVKEFLTIAGFNLPMAIFHAFTTGLLLKAERDLRYTGRLPAGRRS